MRLDPKHFNKFLIIIASICVVLIAFFSMRYLSGQHSRFVDGIGDGRELYEQNFRRTGTVQDSLSASVYKGAWVLVDFWSPWANRSMAAHRQIMEIINESDERIIVFSPSVKDSDDNVIRYAETHDYPYIFVDGTLVYQQWSFPRVPSYLLYNPEGKLQHVKIGYTGSDDFEFLKKALR